MTDPVQIGKYEILEQIGRGGFSAVYKARDPFIGRLVAIKVCLADEQTFRERFFREAHIGGNLDHPNIVTVFDFGTENDKPYIVQEYLTGHDLGQTIERGEPLSIHRRLEYIMKVAKGLQYAHGKGVLHRDIKPGNVRVLEDGAVKIMDFGIATLKSAHTRLTSAGNVVGTASYLAPEQIGGGKPSESADIFSYGVLAYELMTYRRPFPGEDFQSVFEHILMRPPEPLRSLWPECPAGLDTLIEHCLEKKPEDRPASFDKIIPPLNAILVRVRPDRRAAATSELPRPEAVDETEPARVTSKERALEERSDAQPTATRASTETTRSRSKWPAILLLAAAAVAMGVAAVLLLDRPTPQEPELETTPTVTYRTWQAEALGPLESADSMGLLIVDAQPWGQLVEISSSDGVPAPLPEETYTPLALRLPPGMYRILLAHPGTQERLACEAILAAAQRHKCSVPFAPPEPLAYFKSLGWWR